MNWDNFKSHFHPSWHSKLKIFIESNECNDIYKFLKQEGQGGKKLAPLSINTYRTFKDTSLDDLLCVIIGDGPYSDFTEEGPIASGVLFGANTRVQTDLVEFYTGIENELFNGLNLDYVQDYNLEYLSKQGVLLLNSSLTTEKDVPNAHKDVWKPFITFLLKEVIGPTGVSILFLGENAQSYRSLVEKTNFCYALDFPRMGDSWKTNGVFKYISDNIWDSNNETIMWLNSDVPF